MRISRERVAQLILRSISFPIAKGSFVMHDDGSAEVVKACNDDGPEDGLYSTGSIVIHCYLPKGHRGRHEGEDGDKRSITWTKVEGMVEL
jgi:hypothetical protein